MSGALPNVRLIVAFASTWCMQVDQLSLARATRAGTSEGNPLTKIILLHPLELLSR